MHTASHNLIGDAAKIAVPEPHPVLSFSPVVIPAPGRAVPLEVRVTVPATGGELPIVLLSHGHGRSNWLSSLEGYAPLAEFWASRGFAVLQPTHLSSAFLGLQSPEGQELHWASRPEDMTRLLDNLEAVEASMPGLIGRLDRSRVAVVGHSLGTGAAAMLLGARNTDPRDGSVYHKPDARIKAGVLLAGFGSYGKDGENMSENGRKMVPFFGVDFEQMAAPALIVWGDEDLSPHLTSRGADWRADPFHQAPGPKDMLVLKGAKHGLGGISGWDAGETQDESPERLGVVQRMTWAYIRSQLFEGDPAWAEACEALKSLQSQGHVESKA